MNQQPDEKASEQPDIADEQLDEVSGGGAAWGTAESRDLEPEMRTRPNPTT